ncbi:hypothetical protein KSF78_0002027 [Schistosoma japonicum]|nr:hypothetical protein KSF78_0002027 [Schistosoma japonicum]
MPKCCGKFCPQFKIRSLLGTYWVHFNSYSMYHRNSTDRSYDDQQLNSVDLSKPINSLKQMPIIPPLCDLDYTWVTNELYLKKINIK